MRRGYLLLSMTIALATVAGGHADETGSAVAERAVLPRLADIDPPSDEAIEASIRRGVDFLVEYQNANGSWGSAQRTKGLNIYAPVPGAHHAFRAATSSLCLSALISSGDDRREVTAAIERGEAWLVEHLPKLRRANPTALYNVWGHAYGIRALLALRERNHADESKVALYDELLAGQIDRLQRYEAVGGGWGYYDFGAQTQRPNANPTSFTTSTVLIALLEAQAAGLEVPDKVIARGVKVVELQRKPDDSYLYSLGSRLAPMRSIHRPGGSLGRSQVCNLALRMSGDETVTDEVLTTWLDRLFARALWLDIGRKRPIPHESHFLVAGYFYYYGHFYAGGCLQQLPPGADRSRLRSHLAQTMLDKQEKDGSWWDYPLYDYHQPYGTAFALMTLDACRETDGESDAR